MYCKRVRLIFFGNLNRVGKGVENIAILASEYFSY